MTLHPLVLALQCHELIPIATQAWVDTRQAENASGAGAPKPALEPWHLRALCKFKLPRCRVVEEPRSTLFNPRRLRTSTQQNMFSHTKKSSRSISISFQWPGSVVHIQSACAAPPCVLPKIGGFWARIYTVLCSAATRIASISRSMDHTPGTSRNASFPAVNRCKIKSSA